MAELPAEVLRGGCEQATVRLVRVKVRVRVRVGARARVRVRVRVRRLGLEP